MLPCGTHTVVTQWLFKGKCLVDHQSDIKGGKSGSPLYASDLNIPQPPAKQVVYGIHAPSTNSPARPDRNRGVRITKLLYYLLVNRLRENGERVPFWLHALYKKTNYLNEIVKPLLYAHLRSDRDKVTERTHVYAHAIWPSPCCMCCKLHVLVLELSVTTSFLVSVTLMYPWTRRTFSSIYTLAWRNGRDSLAVLRQQHSPVSPHWIAVEYCTMCTCTSQLYTYTRGLWV